MPFKSKSQQRYLFAKKPGVAKEMAEKTKDFKKLPEKKEKWHTTTDGKMRKK